MFSSNTTQVSDGGYQISRSLRFNSADSAYLNRTPATTTNRTTWTWSGWVKRASFGSSQVLFGAGPDGSNYTIFYFSGTVSENLEIYNYTASATTGYVYTNSVFRDPSAWYHVVLAVDTTQGTSADRTKIYVNNVLQPITISTTFGSSVNTWVNTNNNHRLGSTPTTSALYGGYMTEVNFIDGQALTPSSFGETNAQTGVWQPKAYSGSYGTNGFYLNFSDNSNTTAATLGKDYSGNGNNWTPNNFSVTAGAGNDSLVDSPTSYGTDTGVGGTVRGNYCTLNPVDTISTVTLANGNLDYTGSSGLSIATFGVSSGKWYWEHKIGAVDYCVIGIYQSGSKSMAYLGQSGVSIGIPNGGSPQYAGVSAPTGSLAAFTSADTIGFALDLDAGTFTVYRNNVSSLVFSGLTGTWFPAQAMNYSASGIFNFGQRPFAYTAPSGFKALCTQNLPTPTIGATSATLANKYYDASLYTGNGSNQTITNSGFQPDWVWIKSRSNSQGNSLVDAVRGASKVLISNSAATDATLTLPITFNSNGFTSTTDVSTNAYTYVAWQWKANGSGSTNTAGSITSTVSASTTSGFSIVTYTGNGTAGATVGHGLSAVPQMIIVKCRDTAFSWRVYQVGIGNVNSLLLNSDGGFTSLSSWNSTTPTSTVFSLGTDVGTNQSGSTFVAYCFAPIAGYSAFGSYTGNGSTDGPFVYTGFRPAYVLIKGNNTSNWFVMDATRSTYNVVMNKLYPNDNGFERTSSAELDLLSNGFKMRVDDATYENQNGTTYIYMAFATSPFKFSLAR